MTSLDGTRVVVTRSAEDSDSLAEALEGLGAKVIRLPTIAIEYPDVLMDEAEEVVVDLLADLYEWVVFSSRPGVVALTRLLSRQDVEPERAFRPVRVAAVGKATGEAFQEAAGRSPDLVPESFTGSDLASALGSGEGRVLLPRPSAAPRSVIDELASLGWSPHELPLYRTVRGDPSREAVEAVRSGAYDVLTFTSGSTVHFFFEIVGAPDVDETKSVVVIGPSTEAVARELGLRVDSVADPHTTDGLVSAIAASVGR